MDFRFNINNKGYKHNLSFQARLNNRRGRVCRKHYQVQRKTHFCYTKLRYDISHLQSQTQKNLNVNNQASPLFLQHQIEQNSNKLVSVQIGILPKNQQQQMSLIEVQKECDALTPQTCEDDFEAYRERLGFSSRFISFEDQWQFQNYQQLEEATFDNDSMANEMREERY